MANGSVSGSLVEICVLSFVHLKYVPAVGRYATPFTRQVSICHQDKWYRDRWLSEYVNISAFFNPKKYILEPIFTIISLVFEPTFCVD